jgi:hypothetical protein
MPEPRKRKSTKNYDAIKRRFIVWLASPELDRHPVTQRGFAEQYDIDESTLSNWKTRQFIGKVNDLVDEHLADDYASAVDSLKRGVKAGSFQHLKLYFEMIGKYVPKIAPTNPEGTEPWSGLPDAAIDREINAIIDAARARASGRAPE